MMISSVGISTIIEKSNEYFMGHLLVVQLPVPSSIISRKVNLLSREISRAYSFHVATDAADVSFAAASIFHLEGFERQ